MNKAGLATICFLIVAASGVGAVTAWRQQNPITGTGDSTPDIAIDAGDSASDTTDTSQTPLPDDAQDQAQPPDDATETGSEPRLSAAEYARLRDFSHRPFELEDEVPSNSNFAQFRQQFKQAIANRNADFILPLLPRYDTGEVAIGFGLAPVADLKLEQSDSWFWSTLEKAMEFGCADVPAADLGYETAGDVVWVCPGTTLAFERQYPAPADAEGIDHYVNNLMIIGENVNLRSQPSLDSEVIALLSNEVVNSYSDGWEQIYSQLKENERHDPINGWTPVEIANGKQGFVYSRYAYAPLDPRLVFGRTDDGDWTILQIPAGD